MNKPYDSSAKYLVQEFPADWLALAGLRTTDLPPQEKQIHSLLQVNLFTTLKSRMISIEFGR